MLILLDIDGVMVPANSWKRPELLPDGFPVFSRKATAALQRILLATHADILLTTSHKANYGPDQWKGIFERREIKAGRIDCLPQAAPTTTRKDEILDWFSTGFVPPYFVIIDDDKSLNDLPLSLKQKLVQTSPLIGLTDELASQALTILGISNPLRA